jgi:hypothetical protein
VEGPAAAVADITAVVERGSVVAAEGDAGGRPLAQIIHTHPSDGWAVCRTVQRAPAPVAGRAAVIPAWNAATRQAGLHRANVVLALQAGRTVATMLQLSTSVPEISTVLGRPCAAVERRTRATVGRPRLG